MSNIKDLLSIGVDGTGTANSVMKWLDTNTATDSIIYDNGTNIGIGTSSPFTAGSQTSLSINGASYSRLDLYGGGTHHLYAYGGSGFAAIGSTSSATNGLIFEVNGSERMRITSSGNVGIGTSAPQAKFHIEGIKRNGRVWEYSQAVTGFNNGTTLNIDILTTDVTNYFVELDFSGTNTGNGTTSVCKTFHTGFLFGTQRYGVGNNNFWVLGVSNPVLSTPSFNVLRLAITNSSGGNYNASGFNIKVMLGASATAVVANISHSIT